MHTLQTLQLLGLEPDSESAQRSVALVAEHGRWEHDGQRYFDGEVEPCINGRTVETGRTSASMSHRSSSGSSASVSMTAGGTVRRRTARSAHRSTPRSTCSTVSRRVRRGTGGTARTRAGGGVPPRTPAVPAQEHRRARRTPVPRVRVPALLALRHPRLDYFRIAGPAPDPGRRSDRVAIEAAARRPLAPRRSPWTRPLPHRVDVVAWQPGTPRRLDMLTGETQRLGLTGSHQAHAPTSGNVTWERETNSGHGRGISRQLTARRGRDARGA